MLCSGFGAIHGAVFRGLEIQYWQWVVQPCAARSTAGVPFEDKGASIFS